MSVVYIKKKLEEFPMNAFGHHDPHFNVKVCCESRYLTRDVLRFLLKFPILSKKRPQSSANNLLRVVSTSIPLPADVLAARAASVNSSS